MIKRLHWIGILALAVAFLVQPVSAANVSDDAWMAKIALDELGKCKDTKDFTDLRDRVEGLILARLAMGPLKDTSTLVDLVYVQRACKYLDRVMVLDDGEELCKWLVGHRDVARIVFRALDDLENSGDAIRTLHDLWKGDKEAVAAFPDLTAAIITTRRAKPKFYQKVFEAPAAVDVFNYYSKGKFCHDLTKMPYELLRYVTDSQLSIADRKWAYEEYKGDYLRNGNTGKTFKEVKFDKKYVLGKRAKRIEDKDFNLKSVRKYGGSAVEMAFFSAEVSKALGVPATVVEADRNVMDGAWTLVLDVRKKRTSWDTKTARIREHYYLLGNFYDPINGSSLPESDVLPVPECANLSLEQREEIDALLASSTLVSLRAGSGKPGLAGLKKFAASYNERLGKDHPVDVEKLSVSKEIDRKLALELLKRAISLSPSQPKAWNQLLKATRSEMLTAKELKEWVSILTKKVARDCPELTCDVALRLCKVMEAGRNRTQLYRSTLASLKRRKDLQGRVLLKMGDDLLASGNKKAAIKAFQDAATNCTELTSISVPAARSVEDILAVKKENVGKIYSFYRTLWKKSKKRKSVYYHDSAYYVFGRKVAQLEADLGKEERAEKTKKKIEVDW